MPVSEELYIMFLVLQVVLIQGGGYLHHPSHEASFRMAVESFPNNRILVFPISSCYPIEPCVSLEKYDHILSEHKDVHVLLRDK